MRATKAVAFRQGLVANAILYLVRALLGEPFPCFSDAHGIVGACRCMCTRMLANT